MWAGIVGLARCPRNVCSRSWTGSFWLRVEPGISGSGNQNTQCCLKHEWNLLSGSAGLRPHGPWRTGEIRGPWSYFETIALYSYMTFKTQKSQKMENEYFFKLKREQKNFWSRNRWKWNPKKSPQDRFGPLHMAEASFSCAVRHWHLLLLPLGGINH